MSFEELSERRGFPSTSPFEFSPFISNIMPSDTVCVYKSKRVEVDDDLLWIKPAHKSVRKINIVESTVVSVESRSTARKSSSRSPSGS